MATTFKEREEAFRLTHDAYVEAELGSPVPSGLRVTPYQLLPESRIFLSRVEGQLFATVTLIPDSERGLPMESIYPRELELLRDQGYWVAEVGCLADRRKDPRRFIGNFCELTRLMAQYAHGRGMDGFVVACHPRHAKFYKSFMCFEEIGGVVDYPLVKNRPAVALFLNFAAARDRVPETYNSFFDHRYSTEELLSERGRMPSEQVNYFGQFTASDQPLDRGLTATASAVSASGL